MANYTKTTNFTAKDSLSTGNPLKIVRGAEHDTEYNNIATAIQTKADLASPALTGTATAVNLTISGNLVAASGASMGSNKITSLANPTNAQDAATKNYTDTAIATQATTDAGLYLAKASNLSDVASVSTSRTNLGLGTIATQDASAVAVTGGAIDNTPIGSTTRSTVKATTLDLGLSTQSVAIGQGNASIMKNRIINGAMVIDQRNAGASVTQTTANIYTVDRWFITGQIASKFTAQQSSTAPTGFVNSLLATSSSAYAIASNDYYVIQQPVEGFNTADLGWGTANAKTVTLSFWVQSSLTGTFGGSVQNSASNRSYPFSYSIPVANTWTQISVTIAGDTSGTWLTTNGIGLRVTFSLGSGSTLSGTAGAWAGAGYLSATGATSVVGTSGATFYITGVQLEVGSSATGFEYVNYQTSLANCQRYYEKTDVPFGWIGNGSVVACMVSHRVTKRASPTISLTTTGGATASTISSNYIGTDAFAVTSSGVTNFTWNSSAEL
jgi:hypothetical protein